jgi:hypothetical protein
MISEYQTKQIWMPNIPTPIVIEVLELGIAYGFSPQMFIDMYFLLWCNLPQEYTDGLYFISNTSH